VDTTITLCVCVQPRPGSSFGALLNISFIMRKRNFSFDLPKLASATVPFKSRAPANSSYRSWAPSNTKTDHGTTTTMPSPWSPSLPERSLSPYALYQTILTPPYALHAPASCATTSLHTNTTRAARRNWTMLRSEEEEATTLRLGSLTQCQPPSPSRPQMRTEPTTQIGTLACRMAV
jgi:hypothetical protein